MSEGFPGFRQCMKLMRKRNAELQESGYFWLLPRAAQFVPELLAEYRQETDSGLRCWLLELLAEARSPELLEVFVAALQDAHDGVQIRGVQGLRKLDTHEARSVLWTQRDLVATIDGSRR